MSFQSDDIIELYNYGHITFKKMKNLKLSTDISPPRMLEMIMEDYMQVNTPFLRNQSRANHNVSLFFSFSLKSIKKKMMKKEKRKTTIIIEKK